MTRGLVIGLFLAGILWAIILSIAVAITRALGWQ